MLGYKQQAVISLAVFSILYPVCSWANETNLDQELTVLPTIIVAAEDTDVSEESGTYQAKSSRSAAKLNLSLKETPQSISVITREQIEQRGLTDISQILDATPGVYVTRLDTERTNYYARGFSIGNEQIDGIPLLGNAPPQDSFFFDRVEVIKGASGLTGSTGNPSATVNMIRKRPAKEFTGNVAASYGTWNNLRQEVDVSIPFTQDGRIRSRIMAAHTDKESYMDYYSNENLAAMAVIEADLGENTIATVGFQYQDNNPKGSTWGAVPYWNADGSLANLPQSFSLAAQWNEISENLKTTYAEIQHKFANDWLIKAAVNYSEADQFWITAYGGSGFPNPDTGKGLGMWTGIWPYSYSDSISYDVYATGPFQLFNRSHELVVGYSNFSQTSSSDSVTTNVTYPTSIADYRTWNGNIPKPTWVKNGNGTENTTDLWGAYATLRLNLADPLNVILGVRYNDYEYTSKAWTATTAKTQSAEPSTTNATTPFFGILYDLNDQWTAYASYTDMFTPSSLKDRHDKFLDPSIGESYEVGLKGSLLENKLFFSTAAFWSKIKDVAVLDKEYNDAVEAAIQNGTAKAEDFKVQTAYVASGQGLKVEGFEIEAIGKLADHWNLTAGYTYVNSISSANATDLSNVPQNQLKLYTNYTFPESLFTGANRLTVGAGVSWQDDISLNWGGAPANSVGNGTITQDSYYLVNASASYKFNDYFTASVNANNLLDEKYYRNVGFYNGVFWGEPRNVTLTLRTKF